MHLQSLVMNCSNTMNCNPLASDIRVSIVYNNDRTYLFHSEEEGYTLSMVGNATMSNDGLITLNENAQPGDIITVTATSTYDNNITVTKNIEVIYDEKVVYVDGNNGQWIDSGTSVNGNIVYKSDAGSYHINGGKSVTTITVDGYTMVKLYIKSYSDSYNDYTEAFAVDTQASRGAGLFTTRSSSSTNKYVECVYELDGGSHTIQVMYSKNSYGDSYDDRGYFYIGECS